MNKNELVTALATKTGFTKIDSTKLLDALLASISESLASGEEVRLVGFGTFAVYQSKATKAKNPRTGAVIDVPATNRPKFRVGKLLKDAVNA
jgi:DNA-binding protein HU-beta